MMRDVSTKKALAVCLLAAACGSTLTGCRGDRTDKPPHRFFPDMDDQQKWDPQEKTEFFADGRTARQPVPGTIAFGRMPNDPSVLEEAEWAEDYNTERAAFLAEDETVWEGLSANGNAYVDYIPVPVTQELIKRGQERFNIYCVACHGFAGDGKGMVGMKWSYPPANISEGVYTDRTQEKGKDGYLFHVVREGVWGEDGTNKMPSYKHAVSEHDAWAIVSYVRALQLARSAPLSDLSPSEREQLEMTKGAATPPKTETETDSSEGGES